MSGEPLVTVVMPTRDRPTLLGLALAYYQYQTYPRRELIVVDNGALHPVDPAAVAAVGGTLLHMPPGTTLGEVLNVGFEAGSGPLCLKMDDDDYYSPDFLATMVQHRYMTGSIICYPTIGAVMPHLTLDLRRWEIRRWLEHDPAGGTILFAREDWEARPYRAVANMVDWWFLRAQRAHGVQFCPVQAPEIFARVRHDGGDGNRGHTWLIQEELFLSCPQVAYRPEELLPAWSLPVYHQIRQDLLAGAVGLEAVS